MFHIQPPNNSPVAHSPATLTPVGSPQTTPVGSPTHHGTPVNQILRAALAPPPVRRADREAAPVTHPMLYWALPDNESPQPPATPGAAAATVAPAAFVNPAVGHMLQMMMQLTLGEQTTLPHAHNPNAQTQGIQQGPEHLLGQHDPLTAFLNGLAPVNLVANPRLNEEAAPPAPRRNLLNAFNQMAGDIEPAVESPQTPDLGARRSNRAGDSPLA